MICEVERVEGEGMGEVLKRIALGSYLERELMRAGGKSLLGANVEIVLEVERLSPWARSWRRAVVEVSD